MILSPPWSLPASLGGEGRMPVSETAEDWPLPTQVTLGHQADTGVTLWCTSVWQGTGWWYRERSGKHWKAKLAKLVPNSAGLGTATGGNNKKSDSCKTPGSGEVLKSSPVAVQWHRNVHTMILITLYFHLHFCFQKLVLLKQQFTDFNEECMPAILNNGNTLLSDNLTGF